MVIMKNQEVLIIKNKSEVLYLQLHDILYIQADGNYCNINLADGGVINTLTYQRAEIARMLSGDADTEQSLDHARAMLEKYSGGF